MPAERLRVARGGRVAAEDAAYAVVADSRGHPCADGRSDVGRVRFAEAGRAQERVDLDDVVDVIDMPHISRRRHPLRRRSFTSITRKKGPHIIADSRAGTAPCKNARLPMQSRSGPSPTKAPLARSEDSSRAIGMSPKRSRDASRLERRKAIVRTEAAGRASLGESSHAAFGTATRPFVRSASPHRAGRTPSGC
jgi:hypothetical protein